MDKPLVETLNIPAHLHTDLNMKVADFILNGQWNIPSCLIQKNARIAQQILRATPMVAFLVSSASNGITKLQKHDIL
jgi:hypothetical protein